MQKSVSIDLSNGESKTKPIFGSSSQSTSLILNILLGFVVCLFTFCFVRFIFQEKSVTVVEQVLMPDSGKSEQNEPSINLPISRNYYDYEQYLVNNTVRPINRTRRYYYIDLGCFDGRDIDHFVHFHYNEISHYGPLNIIAFEPDPINLSACKISQQKHSNLNMIVHDAAVWLEDGKTRYAIEKGQRSKIDADSALYVKSVDFSKWLSRTFTIDDFVYVKFTVEGAEIPILERMVYDGTLALIDNMEIEWNDALAPDFEPRRVVLECMFDNFGMDFLYMTNPVDSRHAYNVKDSFWAVPKDKGWSVSQLFSVYWN